MKSIGLEEIAEHERALTRRALSKLLNIEGVTVYGRRDPNVPRSMVLMAGPIDARVAVPADRRDARHRLFNTLCNHRRSFTSGR